jgi:hypothetical protein
LVTFVEVTNYSKKKIPKAFRKSLIVRKLKNRQMRGHYQYLRGFAAYSELFKNNKHIDGLLLVYFWRGSTLFGNGCQPLVSMNVGLQRVTELTAMYLILFHNAVKILYFTTWNGQVLYRL